MIAHTILEIVTNTPYGITVYSPNINEFCRDIFEETGVMLEPTRLTDSYESEKLDWHTREPYINTRINKRKFKIINKNMEIKIKIHEVGAIQQLNETFKKRDLIGMDDSNPTYPEYIKFEALQDKVTLLDELRPGDDVTVHFNLRGRPYTDKAGKTSYFNSLVIWKLNINRTVAGGAPASSAPAYSPPDLNTAPDESDDLPF